MWPDVTVSICVVLGNVRQPIQVSWTLTKGKIPKVRNQKKIASFGCVVMYRNWWLATKSTNASSASRIAHHSSQKMCFPVTANGGFTRFHWRKSSRWWCLNLFSRKTMRIHEKFWVHESQVVIIQFQLATFQNQLAAWCFNIPSGKSSASQLKRAQLSQDSFCFPRPPCESNDFRMAPVRSCGSALDFDQPTAFGGTSMYQNRTCWHQGLKLGHPFSS